jgi:hypothetical protein
VTFFYRQISISQYNIEDNLLRVNIPDTTTVLAENGTCLLFSKYYNEDNMTGIINPEADTILAQNGKYS